MSGEQARRAGQLEYTPLWPSTSPQVIFGFADRATMGRALQALAPAVHSGKVCPTCQAYTWEAKQILTPNPALDPVCGMVADRDHSPTTTHGGTTYYFCSTYCPDRFVKHPEMYAS